MKLTQYLVKRALFLLANVGVVFAANGQMRTPAQSVLFVEPPITEASTNNFQQTTRLGRPPVFHYKTTRLKKRDYNYVDYLALSNPAILTDSNYFRSFFMWGKANAQALYNNGSGGLVLDTISLCSFGSVIHPFWPNYNSSAPWGATIIEPYDGYSVDSVYFSGYYGRNPAKPGVMDTLLMSVMYTSGSSNSPIPMWYSIGNTINYGVDTVRELNPYYDITRRTILKAMGTTGTMVSKARLLSANDTGSRSFALSVNLSVPAGNYVVATCTFISGEETTYPAGDTVFRGSANASAPFKYGMFCPYVYFEKASGSGPGFPTYTPGNYNAGLFKESTDTATQATAHYSANFFWNASDTVASAYQFPDVDWILSCPTCYNMVANITATSFSAGNPYPNPSNNNVTLPITMKETSEVSVTLSNVMGQVVAVQRLGKLAAQQTKNVTFNTEALADGIYVLTIEAEGARESVRLAVAY